LELIKESYRIGWGVKFSESFTFLSDLIVAEV